MKRRSRPLCETPRNGYFCGPDKYLRLQEHTIREELFPIMEVDSYFVLVRRRQRQLYHQRRGVSCAARAALRGSNALRC